MQSPLKKTHLKAHILSMTQQRGGRGGRNLTNQHSTVKQLDSVLTSMFRLLDEDVEPFIDDPKARVALKSYKSLTSNLLKTLKQQQKVDFDDL